jgi:DNA-binding MarR family transcriptional regulator
MRAKQLQDEQSHNEKLLSTPSAKAMKDWRVFFEVALAIPDILDAELQQTVGLSLRWYDVLVQLEEAGQGTQMNELAGRILASKSGLTRVIDKMEEAGLVRRERPADNRRVVLVHITDAGLERLAEARRHHRDSIRRHFTEHLTAQDMAMLAKTLGKVRGHVRPLRPGRFGG